jgi:hypothetical protein
MLSRQQFQTLADEMDNGEGFSVRAFGRGGNRRAMDRYMVASGDSPEGDVGSPASPDALRQYASDNRAALSQPHAYLGGWGSSVDVSHAYPRIPTGHLSAAFHGIINGEDAIGEVDREGNYVGDIPTSGGMMITQHRDENLNPLPNGPQPLGGYRTPENARRRSSSGPPP